MSSNKYDVIYADPPWYFSGSIPTTKGSTKAGKLKFTDRHLDDFQYPTMRISELEEFFSTTVADLASDDAVLLLWTTDAHLDVAIRLGELAGFTYRTIGFIWNKKTVKGNQVCFMGRWTMKGSEICLLFSKGKAHSKHLKARNVRQLVEAERREHSRKPDEVRDRIALMFPEARKIELFARTTTPGWDVHGNETEKFD